MITNKTIPSDDSNLTDQWVIVEFNILFGKTAFDGLQCANVGTPSTHHFVDVLVVGREPHVIIHTTLRLKLC